MNKTLNLSNFFSSLFALLVFVTGIANLIWVHAVPGVVYLLLSLVYLPPVNDFLQKRFGFSIPPIIKIMLGILLIMFTLGVSDLGDMID